jgi:hypothetical protein
MLWGVSAERSSSHQPRRDADVSYGADLRRSAAVAFRRHAVLRLCGSAIQMLLQSAALQTAANRGMCAAAVGMTID